MFHLEELRDFLAKHEGHRLYLSGDHDSEFPPELIEMQNEELESDYSSDDLEQFEKRRAERTANGEFKLAVYEIACLGCGTTYAAADAELLRSFERLPIEKAGVDLFLERWGSRTPDDGWNHRLLGLLDPFESFMEGLPQFLRTHEGHRLEARLMPEHSE